MDKNRIHASILDKNKIYDTEDDYNNGILSYLDKYNKMSDKEKARHQLEDFIPASDLLT